MGIRKIISSLPGITQNLFIVLNPLLLSCSSLLCISLILAFPLPPLRLASPFSFYLFMYILFFSYLFHRTGFPLWLFRPAKRLRAGKTAFCILLFCGFLFLYSSRLPPPTNALARPWEMRGKGKLQKTIWNERKRE